MVFRLLNDEGIFVGASSALNAVAAYDMALTMPKGSTIVSILCDGVKYINKYLYPIIF